MYLGQLTTIFLVLLGLLGLSGCNTSVGTVTANLENRNTSTGGTTTPAPTVDNSLAFNGLDSITNVTDSTLTLNWTAHADAISYFVYNTTTGAEVQHTFTLGQASATLNLSSLTAGATYKFRVHLRTASNTQDSNTNDITVTMDPAPALPSALTLIDGSAHTTPVIRVGGVRNNDTIRLFTDNTCATQVASGVSSGATVDLTTSALSVGTKTLYASATSPTGVGSGCSTVNLTYYVFNGISSTSNKTDSTIRLNWVAHTAAASYNVYTVVAGVATLHSNVAGQSTALVNLATLTPGASYTFRVRLLTSGNDEDTNESDVNVTMDSAPSAPTGLTLVSSATMTTPVVRVAGVKSGDTVRLYSDSGCTTQVSTGAAAGTTIDLTSNALAIGTTTFYAAAINGSAASSACSTASLTYYVFNGLASTSGKTDSTITLSWVSHAAAASYVVYNTQSGTPVQVTTVAGGGSSSVSLTGLTPGTTYKFRVRLVTAGSAQDTNTNDLTVTMDSAPDTPSGLTLVSSATMTTPVIRVAGVKSGDSVKLYTNNTCTTQVGSGTAAGTTIDITSSTLAVGTTTFYATSTNAASTASACSTASLTYYVFNGLSSTSSKTDSTIILNWTSHPAAASYNVYTVSAGVATLHSNVAGPSTAAITGLTPGGTYTFRVRLLTAGSAEDTNVNDITVTMDSAPAKPSAITFVSSATMTTPVIQVGGVKNGDTVKLFTDNTCATEVASGVAAGTTINLTTSALAIGTVTFYASSTNAAPTGSGCSTASLTYYVFAGLSSITSKSDTALTLNWTAHAAAAGYTVYTVSAGVATQHSVVAGQASNSTVITGLTAGATYVFRVRLNTASSANDTNTNDSSVTMDAAPAVPSGLTLQSGTTNTAPVVRVAGVKDADAIKLYTNNTCTTLVGSGTASGATIDITSSALAVGTYNFYATATSPGAVASACSTATLRYYVFAGLASTSNKTDSTLDLSWVTHADATSYNIYNTSTSTTVAFSTAGSGASSKSLTGLTPGATYVLRVRMTDGTIADTNSADLSVTMNTAPDKPSGLALQTPSSSPGFSTTPTIRISGVKNGDTVYLYSDSGCSTQKGSGTASGATIDITSSAVSGTTTFYASASNSIPNSSGCSTASVSYTVSTCPSDFVMVPANATLGTSDFCVSQYEMRKNGSGQAVRGSTGTLIEGISQAQALTWCSGMNTTYSETSKYFLISNAEWMAIARNAESVGANWNSGTAGDSGSYMFKGHTDNSPGNSISTVDNANSYNGTGNASGSQKRTLTLSNGNIIWDFSGNLWEWVDWTFDNSKKPYSSAAGMQAYSEYTAIDTYTTPNAMPSTSIAPFYSTLGSAQNLGMFYPQNQNQGGAVERGGAYDRDSQSGVYALNNYNTSSDSVYSAGVRCVYRP